MNEQSLAELEHAAKVILAAPNEVTNDQRRLAEGIFLGFRKTKQPYTICQQILEQSSVDYVKFEAAETLKCAIIREWPFLDDENVVALRQYLLNYICSRPVAPFVQERILQVIAIIVKRGSVSDFGQERGNILAEVENLIITGDQTKQILGCKVIANIMQEYANTVKSTDVGLPWEMHFRVKKQFESTDLLRIFRFCARILSEVVKSETPFAANMLNLLQHIVKITEDVLVWSTLPKIQSGLCESVHSTERSSSLRLGSAWKETILDPHLLSIMFQIYWKVRDVDGLAMHAMTCLVQLASLNGEVLDTNSALEYLKQYMENFLKLISSVTVRSLESVGIAHIILNIRLFFPSYLDQLPRQLQMSYCDEITRLTCCFIDGSLAEEVGGESSNYSVGLDTILEAWTLILSDFAETTGPMAEFLEQASTKIFNAYVQFHLFAPAGDQASSQQEVDLETDEDNDRIKYCDQLQAIGLFGRIVPQHSLPILFKLLEERIEQLSRHLQVMLTQAMTYNESLVLEKLFEDIHWTLLIAGHTLCMDSEGETPLIPSEIMHYSIKECNGKRSDLESTLKTMASVQQLGTKVDCIDRCDDAVRIFTAVMQLCTIETRANESKLGAFMSPAVGCTLMWFMKRWCVSYLLPTEVYYEEISPVIIGALGKDTEGSTFVINFLLSKIFSNIYFCKEEPILLRDTVELFSDVVSIKDKSAYIVKTEGLWNLIKLQNEIPLGVLPATVRRGLYRGFITCGSSLSSDSDANQYYDQLLMPLHQRLKEILCKENFNRVFHEASIKTEIGEILERLIGACRGCTTRAGPIVFDCIIPILSELPVLLAIYHNYPDMVQLILELFRKAAKHMLCRLDHASSQQLYEAIYGAIETYAKYNKNRLSAEVNDEEANLEEVSLVVGILSSVLSKDWLHLDDSDAQNYNSLEAIDVVLYGLQFILPLMNGECLKYPKLSHKYYTFLVMLVMYVEKMVNFNEEILRQILVSVEIGLSKLGNDVVCVCLDFIKTVATHIVKRSLKNTKIDQMMAPYLKLVLNMTLMGQIEADIIPAAATCIYALACCYREEYNRHVEELIQMQGDDAIGNRLAYEFQKLNEFIPLKAGVKVSEFRDYFDKFIANVHGFLLVK